MKVYIGTKIIAAEPMTALQFSERTGGRIPGGNPAPDTAGYFVMYEDGYTSWSPKAAFEGAYREITPGEVDSVIAFSPIRFENLPQPLPPK